MRERDVCERRNARRTVALLFAAGLLGAGSTATAQQQNQPQEQGQQQDPQQQAEAESRGEQPDGPFIFRTERVPPEGAAAELEQARRELEEARRNVEQAAREMAQREREQAALERQQVQLEQQQAQRERLQARREQLQVQREQQQQAAREQQAAALEAERERAEVEAIGRAEREQSLERARQELQAARRNLEEAAREVAQLSARAVAPFVQDLQRQWLGTGQRATLGLVVEDDANGARITGVSPGGPADEAGVRIDDVIVGIDGRALGESGGRASRVLIERLSDVEPGAVVSLEIRRDGASRNVSVETRERDDRVVAFEAPRVQVLRNLFQPAGRWSSVELVTLTPELGAYFGTDRGLLVVRAPDDEALMLEDGDVILDIGGREPNSPEHAMRILGTFEPGETVELTIMRRQQRQTLAIPLTDEETDEDETVDDNAA